jgi:hypothetical protein
LKKSLALGDKASIVAFMDEDMAGEAVGGAKGGPASSASGGVIVGTLPGEFGTGCTVSRQVADVEIRLDRPEDEFAAVLPHEGDVGRFKEIKVLSSVHLGDTPLPGKGSGEHRRAFRHHEVCCAISFSSNPCPKHS